MCLAADDYARKFGYQRAQFYTGVTNQQKALTPFDKAVYYPTNWHNSGYATQMAKTPNFIKYGALVPVAPEYLQKNYLGIFPIGQQPIVDDTKPYMLPRLS